MTMRPRIETLIQNSRHPTGIAAITPFDTIRVDSLRLRIATNAAAMRKRGGERWIPLADNALDFAIAFLALLSAGKQVIMPPSNRSEAINDPALKADGVLAAGKFSDITLPVVELKQNEECRVLAPISGDSVVELFTSGSTGVPKCVRKKFRQLGDEAEILAASFDNLLGSATVFATVPHFHIYGLLFHVLWPLSSGRPFGTTQTLTPHSHNNVGTVLVSSPAFLKRLTNPVEFRDNALRAIFSSGGVLPHDAARRVTKAAACPLIEVYGSTETGGIAWRCWPAGGGDGEHCWRYFEGVQHRLEDTGEGLSRLHVKSLATGDEWIDTGDAIESLEDGFHLLGRIDGILKVEDKRVSLIALEAWLEQHDLVQQAKIVVLAGRRDELAAVVQLRDGVDQVHDSGGRRRLAALLKGYLARRFDHVTLPRRWRFVSIMPLTATGKIAQQAVLELFRKRMDAL